jgi:hypothetical protein
MSVPPPLLTAIAFQLSAALENYQSCMDALDNPWSDRECYEELNRKFDDVRMLKGAIPQLSVPMVEVFIAHVELMEGLWLAGSPTGAGQCDLRALRSRHTQAVESMREQCVRIFTRD